MVAPPACSTDGTSDRVTAPQPSTMLRRHRPASSTWVIHWLPSVVTWRRTLLLEPSLWRTRTTRPSASYEVLVTARGGSLVKCGATTSPPREASDQELSLRTTRPVEVRCSL